MSFWLKFRRESFGGLKTFVNETPENFCSMDVQFSSWVFQAQTLPLSLSFSSHTAVDVHYEKMVHTFAPHDDDLTRRGRHVTGSMIQLSHFYLGEQMSF